MVGLPREFTCETDVGFEIIQTGALIAHVVTAGVVIPVFDFDLYGGNFRIIVNMLLIVSGDHSEYAEGACEFQRNDGFSIFLSFEMG